MSTAVPPDHPGHTPAAPARPGAAAAEATPWGGAPPEPLPADRRADHVRACSPFVAGLLDRHPAWLDGLDDRIAPTAEDLRSAIAAAGPDSEDHTIDRLNRGLREFRNHQMARIIWRDLCGLSDLDETFAALTRLAELCLDAALDAHFERLVGKHGEPLGPDGESQRLTVIGLGKFGGGELNLSSDIDIIFCIPGGGGETAGGSGRPLANDAFFIRQARGVIASLSDVTAEGFCFRVDTRLRPYGDASPLCTPLAALEQYYQREGRDWERYALIKARPVAGDHELGKELMQLIRPFVYRRYIDFSAIEALQNMHASVREDARRKERLDDIKRGPGGIREIEFLAQCFQILRGGREPVLQTPSLAATLDAIGELELLEPGQLDALRADYVFLRQLENRIQALHDQQEHRMPHGDDRGRLARAMGCADTEHLERRTAEVRQRVEERFRGIFPHRPEAEPDSDWSERWRAMQFGDEAAADASEGDPSLQAFLRALSRRALSQRARRRLDRLMPLLLRRLAERSLDEATLNRIYDLILAISQRSAYLVLLVQNPAALNRMIDLFARSAWIAEKVTRFPALLDELIDPSLGRQIPTEEELGQSVNRLLAAGQGAEAVLDGLNYLRLAITLRIAVALLQDNLRGEGAQTGLAGLAAAVLRGVLELAAGEIEQRHGRIDTPEPEGTGNSLAIIAYGSLGAFEPGFDSDLDIVFLFRSGDPPSGGARSLPAERYYARLAQRTLSFLTAMTPSGRLYAVDTRLRPNGRAGSLVSSVEAFSEYQEKEAWTWELQALTRARAIAGNPSTGAAFEAIRKRVLSQPRDADKLQTDLTEMRARIQREHGEGQDTSGRAKLARGGLIDIEFIIQRGVLESACDHPEVLRSTASLEQLHSLVECGWIGAEEAASLERAARGLRQSRMWRAVTGDDPENPHGEAVDPDVVRSIFEARVGPLAEPT
ncbi:bifunctional [glutamate--ammonia ligase]-adenylyl-L-tyrosine phosphorylase/[glutamate--ammonia-ligase] adenylyltransferase [Elongatibacter sediminis]|uniref:Bifunctional glutamine synthetase adenylyltransferase/adenylyl-removing enzyme n=1 Tax=Elongatibacter sediminis TaxID=3119006 RepID=A0AAW9RG49_9GAMM